MLEKEVKIILTKEKYETLKDFFNWEESFTQINYYYGDLNTVEMNSEITVRVRKVKDDFILQIKKPVKYQNSLHIKEETEKRLEELPEVIKGDQLKEMVGGEYPDFAMLGKLETKRYVYHAGSGIEICLDESRYFDKIDYEIEIEFKNEMPTEIIFILKEKGIVPKEKVYGKFARFMSAYLEKM